MPRADSRAAVWFIVVMGFAKNRLGGGGYARKLD